MLITGLDGFQADYVHTFYPDDGEGRGAPADVVERSLAVEFEDEPQAPGKGGVLNTATLYFRDDIALTLTNAPAGGNVYVGSILSLEDVVLTIRDYTPGEGANAPMEILLKHPYLEDFVRTYTLLATHDGATEFSVREVQVQLDLDPDDVTQTPLDPASQNVLTLLVASSHGSGGVGEYALSEVDCSTGAGATDSPCYRLYDSESPPNLIMSAEITAPFPLAQGSFSPTAEDDLSVAVTDVVNDIYAESFDLLEVGAASLVFNNISREARLNLPRSLPTAGLVVIRGYLPVERDSQVFASVESINEGDSLTVALDRNARGEYRSEPIYVREPASPPDAFDRVNFPWNSFDYVEEQPGEEAGVELFYPADAKTGGGDASDRADAVGATLLAAGTNPNDKRREHVDKLYGILTAATAARMLNWGQIIVDHWLTLDHVRMWWTAPEPSDDEVEEKFRRNFEAIYVTSHGGDSGDDKGKLAVYMSAEGYGVLDCLLDPEDISPTAYPRLVYFNGCSTGAEDASAIGGAGGYVDQFHVGINPFSYYIGNGECVYRPNTMAYAQAFLGNLIALNDIAIKAAGTAPPYTEIKLQLMVWKSRTDYKYINELP